MKKKIIISIIVGVLLLSFGAIIYAAYTHSLSAQRTIAPYDNINGDRFSSNYLTKVADSVNNHKTVFVSSGEISPQVVVTICNYIQGRQNKPNTGTLNYTITARLVYLDNGVVTEADSAYISDNLLSAYSVTITNANGSPSITLNSSHLSDSTLTGTLTANVADSDTYVVEFSANFAVNKPNLYLEMSATDGDTIIKALFSADIRTAGASNAWTGRFNDDDNNDPYDYDGYNYLVSGVGAGTVTIEWDSAHLTLSYESIAELIDNGATLVGNTITFDVDSSVTDRYELQFYKVSVSSSATWDTMEGYVTFGYR